VRRACALAAVVLACGVSANASATTQPSLTVRIEVGLSPQRITLSQTSVRRGYYAQFRVRNRTSTRRRFTIAGRSILVPPLKARLMVVDFLVRGRYAYASHGPRSVVRGVFRVS
jgi:hypothetical protein